MPNRTTHPPNPLHDHLDPAQGGIIDLSQGPGIESREPKARRIPMTNAEKQAAHRARKAAELADLQQQIGRLTGSAGTKAEQITAAVAILTDLTDRLIKATDSETADEIAASYAAAAAITRAKHHAAAALDEIQRADIEAKALNGDTPNPLNR